MQPTGDFDDEITNDAAPETDGVLDHPTAFDAAVDVFDPHPSLGERLIVGFLLGRERAATGLLDRLVHRHAIQGKAEESQILEQFAIDGQRIVAVLGQIFVMHPPFKGRAEEDNLQGRVDHERVFQGMIFGFAAVMEGLLGRVGRARDGALGGVVAKRGGAASSGGGPSSEVWAT
jgi:hypothetical protein